MIWQNLLTGNENQVSIALDSIFSRASPKNNFSENDTHRLIKIYQFTPVIDFTRCQS